MAMSHEITLEHELIISQGWIAATSRSPSDGTAINIFHGEIGMVNDQLFPNGFSLATTNAGVVNMCGSR